jgi:hypothetical protein
MAAPHYVSGRKEILPFWVEQVPTLNYTKPYRQQFSTLVYVLQSVRQQHRHEIKTILMFLQTMVAGGVRPLWRRSMI